MEPIVEVELLVLVKFKLEAVSYQIPRHSVGALSCSNGTGKGVLRNITVCLCWW